MASNPQYFGKPNFDRLVDASDGRSSYHRRRIATAKNNREVLHDEPVHQTRAEQRRKQGRAALDHQRTNIQGVQMAQEHSQINLFCFHREDRGASLAERVNAGERRRCSHRDQRSSTISQDI